MTCHHALPTLQMLIHQNLLIMPSQVWLPCDHSRLGLEIQSDKNGALLYFLVYGSNALVMLELH
jgi:hypothetical protein